MVLVIDSWQKKHSIEIVAPQKKTSMKKLNFRCLIATLKTEGTLFSLLMQFQKHFMFLVNVFHKLRGFFIKLSNTQGSQMYQTSAVFYGHYGHFQ